jgi:hypothetical protein
VTNLQGAGREGGTEICMSPSLLPGHARWKRAQTWIILEWFELLATKTGPSTSFIFSLTHICCLYIFSQPSRHAPASTCFVCTLCCFVCTLYLLCLYTLLLCLYTLLLCLYTLLLCLYTLLLCLYTLLAKGGAGVYSGEVTGKEGKFCEWLPSL